MISINWWAIDVDARLLFESAVGGVGVAGELFAEPPDPRLHLCGHGLHLALALDAAAACNSLIPIVSEIYPNSTTTAAYTQPRDTYDHLYHDLRSTFTELSAT